MSDELNNFIEQAIIESIEKMSTTEWSWPAYWDNERKLHFIDQCMQFAEKREFYEQCAVLRDVKETIK